MAHDHPPADFHLPLRECLPGVWLASSRVTMRIPLRLRISFSRNMVAVLGEDGWVLLNPVRLGEAAEGELLARAPIRHAVRLGTFHGRDDAYYSERFGAQFWSVPGKCSYPQPAGSRTISEDGPFPIPGAKVLIYGGLLAEGAVYLPQQRLLVTCDSVQNYQDDPLISPLGRLVMRPLGFFTPCVIGPLWLKANTPPGGSLRADFERVLALDFDHLIGGHGTPRIGGAREALARNVARL